MSERTRYRFGPLERRGLIAGWRGGQIAAVASGLVVGLAGLRANPNAIGLAIGLCSLASALAVACWPICGRTAEEWLPVVVRWGADGLKDRGRRSAEPVLGFCAGTSRNLPCQWSGSPAVNRKSSIRGAFSSLAVVGLGDGDAQEATVGAIHDRQAQTLTGVLGIEGHSFALAGHDEKERPVGGWSSALAALAREGSPIHRVQWVATSLPDRGRAVRDYLTANGAATAATVAHDSYAALLDEVGTQVSRHAVLVAVQVKQTARRWSRPGSAASSLLRELDNVARLLADADATPYGPLDPPTLALTLRALSEADPGAADLPACPPCRIGSPWPMASEVEWSRVRTDQNWHVTYWISEWPRIDVGPDFLGPLLLGNDRRVVSLVLEPVSPGRAARAVEQARTADMADNELRRRGGFLSTARRNREAEVVVRRERELADGHGSYRFTGYVTVTAQTVEELEAACRATEHAAGQSLLELRRLYGDQERALLCTLPLGQGLA
jgi:hypothetical protein